MKNAPIKLTLSVQTEGVPEHDVKEFETRLLNVLGTHLNALGCTVSCSSSANFAADSQYLITQILERGVVVKSGFGTNDHVEVEAGPSPSLLSEDGRYVRLPYGGPDARIDLERLIWILVRRGNLTVPIAKKHTGLSGLTEAYASGLDAILRREFLPANSPYRNTSQATIAVVDALVESGLFYREIHRLKGFYRPVQCLTINRERVVGFVKEAAEY